jgi:hypothetical protein
MYPFQGTLINKGNSVSNQLSSQHKAKVYRIFECDLFSALSFKINRETLTVTIFILNSASSFSPVNFPSLPDLV